MNISNMKLEDLMNEKIYQMSDILRFSTRKRMHEESVATHSFMVAYQCMVLGEVLELSDSDKLCLMQMAISHDLEEIFTTDVISPVKQAIPGLEEALTKYGRENVSREFHLLKKPLEHYYEEEDKQTALWQIMKLADYLSVLYYVNRELEFGSKADDIMEIKVEMTKTCREVWKKIQSWYGDEPEEEKDYPAFEVIADDMIGANYEYHDRGIPDYIITKSERELEPEERYFMVEKGFLFNEKYPVISVSLKNNEEKITEDTMFNVYVGFDCYDNLPVKYIREMVWEK